MLMLNHQSYNADLQARVLLGVHLGEVCGGDALKLSQQTPLIEPFSMDIGVHQSIEAVSNGAHRLLLSFSLDYHMTCWQHKISTANDHNVAHSQVVMICLQTRAASGH